MTAAPASPPAATALDIATRLVCSLEGFSATPYQDTAGVWTIGYGSTRIAGEPVTPDMTAISEAQAMALMRAELEPICATVAARSPRDATPGQIAACTSFAYNEGINAFIGSTLLRLWLYDGPEDAAVCFMQWVYDHDPVTHQLVEVPGLKNRRLREQAVFLGTATA